MMSRGGFRPGAGRPVNSGSFAEKTVARRIPESLVPALDQYLNLWKLSTQTDETIQAILSVQETPLHLPLFSSKVAAGLPDLTDEHQEYLNLTDRLVPSPTSSFMVQVNGDSMIEAGIHHNDLLVVNRAIEPKQGHVVIASVNGEITVKRLMINEGQLILMPENPHFQPLIILETMEFHIWGVVTSVIHAL
jgi:DNA polymerase V